MTPNLIDSYFFDGSAKIIGLVWVCSTSYSGLLYLPESNRVK